jgi:hypothetical protein
MKKTLFDRILITIFIVASNLITYGQTSENLAEIPNLNALLIIVDDYENPNYNLISESVKRDFGTVSKFLDLLNNRKIVNLQKKVLMATETSGDNIKKSIEQLNGAENDILLIYFSGHGGMRKGKNTFLYSRDGKEILRDSIEHDIMKKKSRLKIIISDACSNPIDGIKAARGFAIITDANDGVYDDIYRNLFLNYSGMLSVSSSSLNEYAWSDNDIGGFYTNYLFMEVLLKEPMEDWKSNLELAKAKTMQNFNHFPSDQKKDLANAGILSQTPMPYSMPDYKPLIDVNPIVQNENIQTINPKPGSNTPVYNIVKIKNNPVKFNTQIVNSSGKDVLYVIDFNSNQDNWEEKKLSKQTVKADETILIDKPATIGVFNSQNINYYDITKTENLVMLSNLKGIVEISVQGTNITNTVDSYEKIFRGKWNWEEVNGKGIVDFQTNNKYIFLVNSKLTEKGEWNIITLNKKSDKEITGLSMQYISDSGSKVEMVYEINSFDPTSMQLLLDSSIIDGQVISLKELQEINPDTNPTVMIFKRKIP